MARSVVTDSLFNGPVAATGGELEFEWSTLLNPGRTIPPAIQHYTGITEEMVRGAPFFEDVIHEIAERLAGRLFVAHNARFDYGFVRGEFARMERKFSSRVACTVKLSRRLYPEMPRHNLDAVIEHHGLNISARHRALPNAQALWQFWSVLRARRSCEELEDVLREITYLKSLPPYLAATLPEELPEGPGVYRFYGEGDALLYVGKSNNIRQRVLAHWQGATRDGKSQKLAELTRRVDWICTAGELGALLTEARLGLERSPGSCFAYQLQRCEGVCIGAEPLRRHTARLKIALASERVRPWPFRGAIGIREVAPSGLEQMHVIDEWRHITTLEDGDALPSKRRSQPFDLDIYRVLTRRLRGTARLKIVRLAPATADEDLDDLEISYDCDADHQDAA